MVFEVKAADLVISTEDAVCGVHPVDARMSSSRSSHPRRKGGDDSSIATGRPTPSMPEALVGRQQVAGPAHLLPRASVRATHIAIG